MKKIRETSVYLTIIGLAFYVLPLFIKDTGSGMFFLLMLIPMICFLTSFIYGMKHSFSLIYSLAVMVLFIPTIFIFYNESAAIYSFIYGVITLVGSFSGNLVSKKNNT